MSTSTVAAHSTVFRAEKASSGIPGYLWCAALAVTSVTIGGHWDVSWHRSIGRDTFWTPAHMAIYMCGVLAGIACGYLVLATTFRRPGAPVDASVGILGFRAPLGAFLAAWGGITMLISAPFDNWWHNAYGLDVKIVSPPHTLLIMGIFGVKLGTILLVVSAMNRTQSGAELKRLQRLLLYIGGLVLVLTMFFLMESTFDIELHASGAYIGIAIGVPVLFAMMWECSQYRWAGTCISTIYMLFIIALIQILPLFPAEPKLGPVYHPVHQFIPPQFPLLLIVPAIVLDLALQRTQTWHSWRRAILAGPLFVLCLVIVEWPFASFLMTDAAKNRFFGTMYFSYGVSSTSNAVMRQFLDPEHGMELWRGLALAAVFAVVSTWVGLGFGRWMRKVQR
jgi:xanthosine utilization system XapX-like protein